MTGHRVQDSYPSGWPAINGHQPAFSHNYNTQVKRSFCDTCGWVGPRRAGRWADRVEQDWKTHVWDIATGADLSHGRTGSNCHCSACARASRLTKEAQVSR